jgi:hypothetical protein
MTLFKLRLALRINIYTKMQVSCKSNIYTKMQVSCKSYTMPSLHEADIGARFNNARETWTVSAADSVRFALVG